MNGPELNAPAVSLASIVAGVGTALSFLPEIVGSIASIFGVLLAYQSWKNKRIEYKLKKIELEDIRAEHEKDND